MVKQKLSQLREMLRLEASLSGVISTIFLSFSRLDKLYIIFHCISDFFKMRCLFSFKLRVPLLQ